MKLRLAQLLILLSASLAAADTFMGTIANIKIHGNYSALPAGTVEVYVSGMEWAPRINKDDPAKKETLAMLLSARMSGTPIYVETTGNGPGGEIRNIFFAQ